MGQSGKTLLSSHDKTIRLTQLAILTALTAIFSFVMLPIAMFEITIAMLPVAIGAVLLGPLAGLFLGTVFGICSFITCFGISALGVMLLQENWFFCFLVCVPTRMAMGLLVGFIYQFLHKVTGKPSTEKLQKPIAVSVSAISAPLLNTVFFLGTFALLFFGGASWSAIESGNNVSGLFGVLFFMTGVNALVELLVSAFIGTAIILAIQRFQSSKYRF